MSFEYNSLTRPKYISAFSQTSNSIVYIVPNGRSFRGLVLLSSTAAWNIDGGVQMSAAPTTEIVLGAGSYITAVSNGVQVVGVES